MMSTNQWPTRDQLGKALFNGGPVAEMGARQAEVDRLRARKRTLGEMASDTVANMVARGETMAYDRFRAAQNAEAMSRREAGRTRTRTITEHIQTDYDDDHRGERRRQDSDYGMDF